MIGLWITPIREAETSTTLKVEGQIAADWVAVLEAACRRHLRAGRHVALDVGGVTFVNNRGLDLLRRLAEHGVVFYNCTPLLSDRLGSYTADD